MVNLGKPVFISDSDEYCANTSIRKVTSHRLEWQAWQTNYLNTHVWKDQRVTAKYWLIQVNRKGALPSLFNQPDSTQAVSLLEGKDVEVFAASTHKSGILVH